MLQEDYDFNRIEIMKVFIQNRFLIYHCLTSHLGIKSNYGDPHKIIFEIFFLHLILVTDDYLRLDSISFYFPMFSNYRIVRQNFQV